MFSQSIAKLKADGLDDLEEIGDVSPNPKKQQQFLQVPIKTKKNGGGGSSVVINYKEEKINKKEEEYLDSMEDEESEEYDSEDEEEDATRASKEKSTGISVHPYYLETAKFA